MYDNVTMKRLMNKLDRSLLTPAQNNFQLSIGNRYNHDRNRNATLIGSSVNLLSVARDFIQGEFEFYFGESINGTTRSRGVRLKKHIEAIKDCHKMNEKDDSMWKYVASAWSIFRALINNDAFLDKNRRLVGYLFFDLNLFEFYSNILGLYFDCIDSKSCMYKGHKKNVVHTMIQICQSLIDLLFDNVHTEEEKKSNESKNKIKNDDKPDVSLTMTQKASLCGILTNFKGNHILHYLLCILSDDAGK